MIAVELISIRNIDQRVAGESSAPVGLCRPGHKSDLVTCQQGRDYRTANEDESIKDSTGPRYKTRKNFVLFGRC